MRIVIQRVAEASVKVEGKVVGAIERGLLVLLGIEDSDGLEDIQWLSNKIVQIRLFDDVNGVMNLGIKEVAGDILLISQITLHASTIKASKPEMAIPLYEQMIKQLEADLGKKIQTGIFGADMKVALLNDGPVTICIDSKNRE